MSPRVQLWASSFRGRLGDSSHGQPRDMSGTAGYLWVLCTKGVSLLVFVSFSFLSGHPKAPNWGLPFVYQKERTQTRVASKKNTHVR